MVDTLTQQFDSIVATEESGTGENGRCTGTEDTNADLEFQTNGQDDTYGVTGESVQHLSAGLTPEYDDSNLTQASASTEYHDSSWEQSVNNLARSSASAEEGNSPSKRRKRRRGETSGSHERCHEISAHILGTASVYGCVIHSHNAGWDQFVSVYEEQCEKDRESREKLVSTMNSVLKESIQQLITNQEPAFVINMPDSMKLATDDVTPGS